MAAQAPGTLSGAYCLRRGTGLRPEATAPKQTGNMPIQAFTIMVNKAKIRLATNTYMVNGAFNMKHLYKAIFGALVALGLASISSPTPTFAGGATRWDPVCNCRRPDHQFNTRRTVRAPARVVTRKRVVTHQRVVRGNTRLIQENRLVVHVRPVINREVVVHRTNTIVKNVVLRKVNTTNKFRDEQRHQVVNVQGGGSVRHVTEYRNVRGVDCNCGDDGGSYRGAHRSYRSPVVSYRY